MADIAACRICLAKDIKLFNIFNYKLAAPFEILTGIQISECDGLPHHICSFCGALLLKCVSFKEKCCSTHEFLKFSVLKHGMLTADYLDSFDRGLHLSKQYTTKTYALSIASFTEDEVKKEEEMNIEDAIEDIKVEPIQQGNEKRVKKDKKNKVSNKEILVNFNDITIKTEDIDMPDYDDGLNFTTEDRSAQEDQEDVEDMQDVEIVVQTKRQQREEVEARKTTFNYMNSFYKCENCYRGFITESTFRNHMARYDPKSGDFVCDICHVRRPDARLLRAHVVRAHERKYVCKLCAHVSRSSHRAREHSRWHKGFKFVCKICGASFVTSTNHLTHIRIQHPTDNSCDICGESFIGEYGLRMHKRRAHKDEEDQDTKAVSYCDGCSAQFFSSAALKRHMDEGKDTCDTELSWCPYCGSGLPTEEAFKEHMKVHQKEIFPCQDCPRTFASARSQATHYQRVHLGLKLRKPKPTLKYAAESVVCEICGKKCASKAILKYHKRIHTGEKPFQCSQCPKKFSMLQRLQIHVRTHTGESPYKCGQCPKAFKHKAALNRHNRVHTGAKPYSCQHCGKTFSQSNSMKGHVNTVHLKIPYPYRNRKKNL